jgi:hypothetical protein
MVQEMGREHRSSRFGQIPIVDANVRCRSCFGSALLGRLPAWSMFCVLYFIRMARSSSSDNIGKSSCHKILAQDEVLTYTITISVADDATKDNRTQQMSLGKIEKRILF